MNLETIKIKFLEEFIKLKDETLVRKLYEALQQGTDQPEQNHSSFSGIWSDEEAAEVQQAVDECRKVNLDEW